MAETTADVRRDIELTRERMSSTLSELEHKLNVVQVVKDHPWPAIALAVGAGFALSGSRADVKAAAATVAATKGASSKVGDMIDDLVASLLGGVTASLQYRAEAFVDQVRTNLTASLASKQPRGGALHGTPDADPFSAGASLPSRRGEANLGSESLRAD